MTAVTKEVYSSHVRTVSYDDEAQQLAVTWDTGKTSLYANVPPGLAGHIMNSWSVGEALHATVKADPARYPHSYAG